MNVPRKIWDEWRIDGGKIEVEQPSVDRDRKTLWLETEMNFVLPFGAAQSREEELSELALREGLIVRCRFRYSDLIQEPEIFVPRLIADFIYKWRKRYSPAMAKVWPENTEVQGDSVRIYMEGQFFADALNTKAAEEIMQMLYYSTGYDFNVEFVARPGSVCLNGVKGGNVIWLYSPHSFEHKHIIKDNSLEIRQQMRLDEIERNRKDLHSMLQEAREYAKECGLDCSCRSKNKTKLADGENADAYDEQFADQYADLSDQDIETYSDEEYEGLFDRDSSNSKQGGVDRQGGQEPANSNSNSASASGSSSASEPARPSQTKADRQGQDQKEKKTVSHEVLGFKIFGKVPNSRVTNIDDVRFSRKSKDKLVIEGTIFEKEVKFLSWSGQKKAILEIWIHDDRGAIFAKKEFPEEVWNKLPSEQKAKLHVGAYVRISGSPYMEHKKEDMVCINMTGAVSIKLEGRKDTCPQKRVELHAHTKMSARDALNEVSDFIKQAAEWGHPAVAITDHGGVQAFPEAANVVAGLNKAGNPIKVLYGVEGYLFRDEVASMNGKDFDLSSVRSDHIIIIAKNKVGLKNLYKLISKSHIDYFYKKPLMPRSVIKQHREGLIIGSACEAGELFRAIVRRSDDEDLLEIAKFYDYLEIQPLINNNYMIGAGLARDEEELKDFNRKVVELGERLDKPVVATCDTHYMNPGDAIYRRILMAAQNYKDLGAGGLYFRTTDEMLKEFSYLGKEKAYELVVENSQKIAEMVEKIKPIPDDKYPPTIEGADETLRTSCYDRAKEIYGDPLPEPIKDRLEAELSAVIDEGYAVMYVSAQMLVNKAASDGYVVGSRGSVGSSFAATMAGITEVNPLAPHYICPECKYLEWGDMEEYDCGVDMPEKECPHCGTMMKRDGYHIPFETFLGNEQGRKEPDIDLNFAGEYQETAQKYVDEIFGAKNVYKAGTITTIQNKTAQGQAMGYYEKYPDPRANYALIKKNAHYCEGVRSSSGQHPGGIIVLPDGMEIEDFCPVQRPAGDKEAKFITTHFDYHAIDKNLLKLDLLGHDVPSIIRHLYDLTGVDPMTVSLQDKGVQDLFLGRKSLKLKPRKGVQEKIIDRGTFGIPEFGTDFVRKMLKATKPSCMGDLIRISGFSHGTNVWSNNAEKFIKEKKASMKDAISTRDDIMNYLEQHGMPSGQAFKIMEKVRKGKGLTTEEQAEMKRLNVPPWYIESCLLIQYLFPKAHAVAYVVMAYRIGYFKVYYPEAFYAAHLTTKVDHFRWDIVKRGLEEVERAIEAMYAVPKWKRNATEENELSVLEVCYELYRRGFEFEAPSVEHSEATAFSLRKGQDGVTRVVVPISGISRVGGGKARKLKKAYNERPFNTLEDVSKRGGVDSSTLERLMAEGFFKDLPETEQIGFLELL